MRGLEKFTFLQKIIVGNKCDLENLRVSSLNTFLNFFIYFSHCYQNLLGSATLESTKSCWRI